MGNLFNALNDLKTNIFGGGNTGTTTPILRKTAIDLKDTSPTSMLSNDPFQFTSISYPRKQISEYSNGHYMLFYVNVQNKSKYKYSGYDAQGNSITVGDVTQVSETFIGDNGAPTTKTFYRDNDGSAKAKYFEGAVTKGAFKGNITSLKTGDTVKLAKSKKARSTGLAANSNPTRRITDSVALYLPPNVQDSTVAAYNTDATGALGFAAAGGMDILRKYNQNDMAGASSALINLAKGFLGNAGLKGLAEVADTFSGGSGGAGLINKFFSQADNPYLEVLFDKMNLRNFSYTFTLAPKNTDERDDIQRIIQLFRFHMSPEVISENNRFLRLPSEFDIHYMYQHKSGQASENDYYNKIATCVMTECDVNYTPDGVNSFDDGSPTKMTMKLSFTELEMLTKEKVNEGF